MFGSKTQELLDGLKVVLLEPGTLSCIESDSSGSAIVNTRALRRVTDQCHLRLNQSNACPSLELSSSSAVPYSTHDSNPLRKTVYSSLSSSLRH